MRGRGNGERVLIASVDNESGYLISTQHTLSSWLRRSSGEFAMFKKGEWGVLRFQVGWCLVKKWREYV